MNIKSLVSAMQTYENIVSFIEGGNMGQLLSTIGDIHLEAAKNELNLLSNSRNKRETVNRAASHLRVALTAYQRKVKVSAIDEALNAYQVTKGVKLSIISMMLLATCYAYLEEWEAVKQIVSFDAANLQTAAGDNIPIGIDVGIAIPLGILNPLTYFDALVDSQKLDGLPNRDDLHRDFEEFRRKMEALIE